MATTTHDACGFEPTKLAKLVQLFHSPEEGEANAAFLRARALVMKSGMSFPEAVETRGYKVAIWEAHSHPAWLDHYFKADRYRLENDRLSIKVRNLTTTVATLKGVAELCPSCENRRRWLAGITGVVLLGIWLCLSAHSLDLEKVMLYGALLAVGPFASVWVRWKFLKRRHRIGSH